jgi:transketolase
MELFKKDDPTDRLASALTRLVIDETNHAKSGHPGMASISLRPSMSSSKTIWWPIRSIRNG